MITFARTATTAAAVSVAALTAGAVLLTGPASASAAAVGSASGSVSAQDTSWAQSNAQTDLAEITIGQIAEQRAQHTATKSLAQMTMSDHQKALSELKTVASQAGITLPTAPNATQQAQAAQLKSVSASQFDATYDSDQVQGHKLSISQTETEISSGSSTAVKSFAQVYLPVAEKHLQMAESDYAQLSGSTSGAPGVAAGTGGMAATRAADDAPWLALAMAGLLVLATPAAFGLRRRFARR